MTLHLLDNYCSIYFSCVNVAISDDRRLQCLSSQTYCDVNVAGLGVSLLSQHERRVLFTCKLVVHVTRPFACHVTCHCLADATSGCSRHVRPIRYVFPASFSLVSIDWITSTHSRYFDLFRYTNIDEFGGKLVIAHVTENSLQKLVHNFVWIRHYRPVDFLQQYNEN